jgi:DNA-binding ferritin-like protein
LRVGHAAPSKPAAKEATMGARITANEAMEKHSITPVEPEDLGEVIDDLANALDARDAEIKRLRAALEQIANSGDDGTQDQIAPDMWEACRMIARTALNGGDHEG